MTPREDEPADGVEAAISADIMRAALATIVSRHNGPLVITEKQRRRAYGVVLRMQLDRDLTIRMWVEPSDGSKKLGVVYVKDVSRPTSASLEETGDEGGWFNFYGDTPTAALQALTAALRGSTESSGA